MKTSLLATILSVAAVAWASDKGHGHNCKKDPIKEALEAQAAFEANIQVCRYASALAQVTGTFSTSLNELGCSEAPITCCVAVGGFEAFISRYNCDSAIIYYAPTSDYNPTIAEAKLAANGTVIVPRWETIIQADQSLRMSEYKYFWNPTGEGWKLNYISGNDFSCPTYRSDLISCSNC